MIRTGYERERGCGAGRRVIRREEKRKRENKERKNQKINGKRKVKRVYDREEKDEESVSY